MAQERGAGRAKPAAEVPEEYRAIFEAVTDGLLITDLATGRIVEVNPAFCRMHGYQREELVGSLTTTVIHPGDHPLFGLPAHTSVRGSANGTPVMRTIATPGSKSQSLPTAP